MALVDLIFLSMLGVSVLTSAYVVGEFLHSAYKTRKSGTGVSTPSRSTWRRGTAKLWMEESAVSNVARSRSRRIGSSSSAPDLLTVTGTGYAVMLLPVRHSDGQPDVIESRLFFN